MKRFAATFCFIAALFVTATLATTAPTQQSKKKEPPKSLTINDKLEKQVDLVFAKVELRDVLDKLGKLHELKFVLDPNVEQQGRPKLSIDVEMKKVKLGTGLRILLGEHFLAFAVIGGVVHVDEPRQLLEKRLQQRIDVKCRNAPLEKVVKDLARLHGVNVVFDPRARQSKAVKTPVTLNIASVPFADAIAEVCAVGALKTELWHERVAHRLDRDDQDQCALFVTPKGEGDAGLRFQASRLLVPIPEIDKGDILLPLLMEQLSKAIRLPEAINGRDKQVDIHLNLRAFKDATEDKFDFEQQVIQFHSQLRQISLATVLETICAQLNAGYLVRKNRIEILPLPALRKELKCPDALESDLRRLVVRFYEGATIREALEDLADGQGRTVLLSGLVDKEVQKVVNVRLVNVPFDAAVETVANMADLRLVRKANVLLVTNKEQAETLNAEHEQKFKADQEAAEKEKRKEEEKSR
jgi:hypothetical protein